MLAIFHSFMKMEQTVCSETLDIPQSFMKWSRLGVPKRYLFHTRRVRKISPQRDSIPYRPAESQPLYRLSYRSPSTFICCNTLRFMVYIKPIISVLY
jgi:hypothetical protein